MAITLDGADTPPRARLVWSLVEHGGQPVDPDAAAYATGVDRIAPETLAAITDLYGVPRSYLTAPGQDPGRDLAIDEDLTRIRSTTPLRRTATTYEPISRAPVPKPAASEVTAIADTARSIAHAATRSDVPWILATLISGVIITVGLAAVGTTATWVLAGLAAAATFARTVYATRRTYRQAGWVHADDATFTKELQQHLRDGIARHLHTLHNRSQLPLEQLVAILDSTTPIGTVQLNALTAGDNTEQRKLITTAVEAAMRAHGYRVGAARFR